MMEVRVCMVWHGYLQYLLAREQFRIDWSISEYIYYACYIIQGRERITWVGLGSVYHGSLVWFGR